MQTTFQLKIKCPDMQSAHAAVDRIEGLIMHVNSTDRVYVYKDEEYGILIYTDDLVRVVDDLQKEGFLD